MFTRWVLVMTHFERELYADPDADLDSIWWELVSRYQLLTPPEGRRAPDWAAKIHIACAPVYYHTYLYGHLVAAQLRAAIRREVGGFVGSSGCRQPSSATASSRAVSRCAGTSSSSARPASRSRWRTTPTS